MNIKVLVTQNNTIKYLKRWKFLIGHFLMVIHH